MGVASNRDELVASKTYQVDDNLRPEVGTMTNQVRPGALIRIKVKYFRVTDVPQTRSNFCECRESQWPEPSCT